MASLIEYMNFVQYYMLLFLIIKILCFIGWCHYLLIFVSGTRRREPAQYCCWSFCVDRKNHGAEYRSSGEHWTFHTFCRTKSLLQTLCQNINVLFLQSTLQVSYGLRIRSRPSVKYQCKNVILSIENLFDCLQEVI